jgi:hemerythrin
MADYIQFIAQGALVVLVIVVGFTVKKLHKKNKETRAQLAIKEKERGKKRAAASKTVKIIHWGEQFVIDGGLIDRDHRTLFGLINEFNQNIPRYRSFDQMVPVLAALKKYTQTHFQREEKLQKVSGYPFQEDHKNEHAEIIKKFDSWVQKAKSANEDTITDVAVEIGSFLRDWLTEHVIEQDLPMKPYVERMREHARGMGALTKDSASPSP